MPTFWENAVIAVYTQYLPFALPATVVIIKIVVRIIAREPKEDIYRSLLVLPLDFTYIAMGVLLAVAARRDSSYMRHYGSDSAADMALALQMVALVITDLARAKRIP